MVDQLEAEKKKRRIILYVGIAIMTAVFAVLIASLFDKKDYPWPGDGGPEYPPPTPMLKQPDAS